MDGEEKDVKEGISLNEVLDKSIMEENYPVAVVKDVKRYEEEKEGKYELSTTKGNFTFSLGQSETSVNRWKDYLDKIKGKNIRWQSNDIFAIGSFSTNIEPKEEVENYERGDIFFGLSGMNNDNTYLMVAKREHSKSYGVKDSKIGRIQKGKHLMDILGMGDRLKNIKKIKEEKEEVKSFLTKNYDLELNDDVSIYTQVVIQLSNESPKSVEQFLKKTENNSLVVNRETETYILTKNNLNKLEKENNVERNNYSVSMRNSGDRKGNLYIYKKNRPSSSNHNVLGKIKHGKELIDTLNQGSKFKVITEPSRILTIGMTQSESLNYLKNNEIKQERKGNQQDEAIVVEQKPKNTMKVIEKGKVKTIGAEPDKVINIELFEEDAPETTKYFKKITGLSDKKIGKLKVYFTSSKISNVMFEGSQDLAGQLLPENTPTESSKPGEIGVTNRSKSSNKGLIGIRLEKSSKYGPTSEDFQSTNIVGRVKDEINKLNNLEDGDIIYIKEEENE